MQETPVRSVRSLGREDRPGRGNDNPLQLFLSGNPMNRGAWRVTVQGIAGVGHNLATQQQQHLPETLEAMGSHAHQVHTHCFPGFGLSFGSSVIGSAQSCPRWPSLERISPWVSLAEEWRARPASRCAVVLGRQRPFSSQIVPYAQDGGTSGVEAAEREEDSSPRVA